MPLESYPSDVWKTFIFDQEAAARKMGATSIIVPESVRQVLFELVNRSRAERQSKK